MKRCVHLCQKITKLRKLDDLSIYIFWWNSCILYVLLRQSQFKLWLMFYYHLLQHPCFNCLIMQRDLSFIISLLHNTTFTLLSIFNSITIIKCLLYPPVNKLMTKPMLFFIKLILLIFSNAPFMTKQLLAGLAGHQNHWWLHISFFPTPKNFHSHHQSVMKKYN